MMSEIILRCPICNANPLIFIDNDQIICQSCHKRYPITHGIYDLREEIVKNDPVVDEMLKVFNESSFEDLLIIMLEKAKLPELILQNTLHYYNDQLKRTERMTSMFLELLGKYFSLPENGVALDLGCGSGAGIAALSLRYKQVIGVDSSMAQLILAKKTSDLLSIGNCTLICAHAKSLPFFDNSFHYIQAINVFEHILKFDEVFKEISRVLRTQGLFAADSRNRFDIFMPEPHTGLRFLGFLPRNWIPDYVRWRCNSQYESTWLLSHNDLKKAGKNNFCGKIKIVFPRVSAYKRSSKFDSILSIVEKIPIIRTGLIKVFSTHIVLGKKE